MLDSLVNFDNIFVGQCPFVICIVCFETIRKCNCEDVLHNYIFEVCMKCRSEGKDEIR